MSAPTVTSRTTLTQDLQMLLKLIDVGQLPVERAGAMLREKGWGLTDRGAQDLLEKARLR